MVCESKRTPKELFPLSAQFHTPATRARTTTGGDTRLTARNKGTTFCSKAENYAGIVFDADGCFMTCKPIG